MRIIESDYIFWIKKQMKKFHLNFCVNCRWLWSIESKNLIGSQEDLTQAKTIQIWLKVQY